MRSYRYSKGTRSCADSCLMARRSPRRLFAASAWQCRAASSRAGDPADSMCDRLGHTRTPISLSDSARRPIPDRPSSALRARHVGVVAGFGAERLAEKEDDDGRQVVAVGFFCEAVAFVV